MNAESISNEFIEFYAADPEKSVLTMLQEQGEYIAAYCGGKGKCGKCMVRFLENVPQIKDVDRRFLSEKELQEGWRLSCTAFVEGPVRIQVPEEKQEEEMVIATDFHPNIKDEKGLKSGFHNIDESAAVYDNFSDLVMAVDIGTTTIAASLIHAKSGNVISNVTSVNHQRAYGADVISRIQASNEGKGVLLQESINDDLRGMAVKLGVDYESVPIIISGNTTMEHLLQGLSCKTLGVAPYIPVDISLHQYNNMTILPGISTYVGADIVSGIIACGMDQSEEVSLLIDLGTNGEMAIGNKNRILATSTAAGPAFEGGNIICGVAGIPGAISRVKIKDGETSVETIADAKAIGICGTGVLEAVFELLDNEIMDETGALDEPYDEDGFVLSGDIRIYARDIREIQLAKSAIRAGAEVLIKEFGIKIEDVAHVYLAGGFGQKIDVRKAVGIGLLPEELEDCIITVGNSSLAGAIMIAKDPSLQKRFKKVALESVEIGLAESKLFNELYIDYMFFE